MRRDIAVSRSEDLLSWTPTSRVLDADDGDDPACELYGMPLFNWGNQYLGMLERYDPTNEILDVQLASSRDGNAGSGVAEGDVLSPTIDPGPPRSRMSMSPPIVTATADAHVQPQAVAPRPSRRPAPRAEGAPCAARPLRRSRAGRTAG